MRASLGSQRQVLEVDEWIWSNELKSSSYAILKNISAVFLNSAGAGSNATLSNNGKEILVQVVGKRALKTCTIPFDLLQDSPCKHLIDSLGPDWESVLELNVDIDPVHIKPSLEYITLGVIGEDAFCRISQSTLKEGLFNQILRYSSCLQVEGITLHLLDQYPFQQGVVVDSTRIIVVRLDTDPLTSIQDHDNHIRHDRCLKLDSDGTCELSVSSFPEIDELLIPSEERPLDYHNLIVVPLKTLMDLDITNGSKVQIEVKNGNGQSRYCWIYLTLNQTLLDRHQVDAFCSPILKSNLGASEADTITITLKPLTPLDEHPGYAVANKVTLVKIAQPPISSSAAVDGRLLELGLRHYFESGERLFYDHDLLRVPVYRPMLLEAERGWCTSDTFPANVVLDDGEPIGEFFLRVDKLLASEPFALVDPLSTMLVTASHGRYESIPLGLSIIRQARERDVRRTANVLKLEAFMQANDSSGFHSNKTFAHFLVNAPRGSGLTTALRHIADRQGLNFLHVNAYVIVRGLISASPIDGDPLADGLKDILKQVQKQKPCLVHLEGLEAFAGPSFWQEKSSFSGDNDSMQMPSNEVDERRLVKRVQSLLIKLLQELKNESLSSGQLNMLVASTNEPEKVPVPLRICFPLQTSFQPLNERDRLELIDAMLADVKLSFDVDKKALASDSVGFNAHDLLRWVDEAKRSAIARLQKELRPHARMLGLVLEDKDLESTLKTSRPAQDSRFTLSTKPNVQWSDVGGLEEAKSIILETIQLPLTHPELFASGKRRSGILLYGPPGTGKTLLAKAIATAIQCSFLSVKGPELMNMYIGESEKNVRDLFARARDCAPCVIFFDELDSIAGQRGVSGDSGGVSDRVVSQLLSELDGVLQIEKEGSSEKQQRPMVVVIGATNRPDLLDPSLLRPGRFDKMIYLDTANTSEAQHKLLTAVTRKLPVSEAVNLERVVSWCPMGRWTGADYYAMCVDATMKAINRVVSKLDQYVEEYQKEYLVDKLTPSHFLQHCCDESMYEEYTKVLIQEHDFQEAINALVPSVSQDELAHYRQVQHQFKQQQEIGR